MRRLFIAVIGILINLSLSGQETATKRFSIYTKLSDDCVTEVSLELLDTAAGKPKLNETIFHSLVGSVYPDILKKSILTKLYTQNGLEVKDIPLLFHITGARPFLKNGLVSFTACTYNACDHSPVSNFETNMITVDAIAGKELFLDDIIDPAQKDTFERYVFAVVNRYRIRNTPTCFISSLHPVEIRSSNPGFVQTNVITYTIGLEKKFYFNDDKLVVYNEAEHTAYGYHSVEVAIPLFQIKRFMRQEMANRIGI